ncbi:MAG: PIN domain-containing protein [Cellulomonadaceae bacterium]|nr:PIN domain-containing protein [Cellulomonadaceae bacterium]
MVTNPPEFGYWYLDSSVILRAAINNSRAAQEWLTKAKQNHGVFVASRLTSIEVTRVLKRYGHPQTLVAPYLGDCIFVTISDSIATVAEHLEPKLSGADSIHIATALQLKNTGITLLTHDREWRSQQKRSTSQFSTR